MAGKKKVKVSPDDQKIEEMKKMETVPLIEKSLQPISNNTSWIFFAITLFFITMSITLLYNIIGQIGELKESVAAHDRQLSLINAGLRTDIESQSSFCSGYDPSGQPGFAIDDRKTMPCAGVAISEPQVP